MNIQTLTVLANIRRGGIGFLCGLFLVMALFPVGVNAQDMCANAANPVVAENCLPGTDNWQVTNYQPEDIAGFVSADSTTSGSTVNFYITSGGAAFDVYVYRTGYYGGLGARLVDSATGVAGQVQPPCFSDYVTGFYSCTNWNASYTLDIPADWVSGVYYVRLVRPDTGGENYMLFTIRDDQRSSAVLYQLAIATYQIYNPYGGKSLYNFNSVGCFTTADDPRAVKASMSRPYVQPEAVYGNTYLFADYAWVYWLEQQGYDVSYITSSDLNGYGKPGAENGLLNHEVILFAVHDEYWSQEMRDATTAARDAGVDLAFFTSNTAFWRIRFEADPQTGEADRVLVTYKTTEGGSEDPSGTPTGTWRDPATVNDPENELVGVMYFGDNDSMFFPLQLTAEMAQDRIYRHTDLQTMPENTVVRLGERIVGWEWDSIVDNGASPEGIVTLAESPVYGGFLTDAGNYRHNRLQTGIADMTRYVAASGAQVFASATNLWSRGLALSEPNRYIQQITYNILADMGAEPSTPAETLIVDDAPETAPEAWEGRSPFYPADVLPPAPAIS
ncbi:MAG: hypothetical protein K8I60_00670, partial [Anaerolineae bacterium]|nr:hypothetical protein [Anaerolineae bacterium]